MDSNRLHILAVDDNPDHIDVIKKHLAPYDYHVSSANNGDEAVWLLTDREEHFDIVLLDRMMPGMDGIEVLKTIKKSSKLKHLPVIMQTAMMDSENMAESIKAGAYYHITKPFSGSMLSSIVNAAAADIRQSRIDKSEAESGRLKFRMVDACCIKIRTMEEAKDTAIFLSNLYPEPDRVLFGIHELVINAIEHGNLNIGYEKKTDLLKEGTWAEEVEHRLSFPENENKFVEINYIKTQKSITLNIKDCGNGFNWQDYMEISPERASDSHGRGIALSALISFDKIEYLGAGNEVSCVFLLGTISPSHP